jgi:hypothetical protein
MNPAFYLAVIFAPHQGEQAVVSSAAISIKRFLPNTSKRSNWGVRPNRRNLSGNDSVTV